VSGGRFIIIATGATLAFIYACNRASQSIADDVLDAFADWSGDTHLVDVMGGGRAAGIGGGGATEQATRPDTSNSEAIARSHKLAPTS
jgi:hypothetical protein